MTQRQRDYVGVLSRHRPFSTCYTESLKSIMALHNEAINIWSHLIPTFWFLTMAVWFAATSEDPLDDDMAVVLIYQSAATFCFACSTLYHVFADHVHADWWQHLDHFGIVTVIWSSAIPFIHFSFDLERYTQQAYIILVSISAVVALTRISASRSGVHFNRTATHTLHGSIAAVPAIHRLFSCGLCDPLDIMKPFWSLVVANCLGGGYYAIGLVHESITMDSTISDASHQFMHATAVYGTWIYERGLISVYKARKRARQSC
ncbi:hemolysin-III related-domain-containing protein [Lophiotrema nucula]|uniref:Hemolysin-III related-domain-containing protein n=1 Tax=Lophiotrema nucula TaxID=690887 RepID=A0A6A5Z486_9PLEO|nr:hemolysin-III related-domain-containing protein [Lophiotrema nucula]